MGRFISAIRHTKYKHRYQDSAPEPYELINVDPNEINYLLAPRAHLLLSTGKWGTYIMDGSWDINYSREKLNYAGIREGFNTYNLIPFTNYVFYNSLKSHFINDIAWDDTEIYDFFMRGKIKRYGSPDQICERFKKVDKLYDYILKNGYMSQSELEKIHNSSLNTKSGVLQPPEYNEVLINIGRTGELIYEDGKHRLSIAKILDIDTIPVRVLVRHPEWQKIRREVSESHSEDDLSNIAQSKLSHPDITPLLDK